MAGITCGIIGLPNVGKSTLFNALTRAGAAVANYPFCTIEPNIGVVAVSDERLDLLNRVEKRPRAVPAVVQFVDIAGLVEGASRGEGRGNEFLEHVRNADALLHVVRCFDAPEVAHTSAKLDPVEDARTVNLELLLADLQMAERAHVTLARKARGGDAEARDSLMALEKMIAHLNEEHPARSAPMSLEEWQALRELRFLTAKPVLYVANVSENDVPEMNGAGVEALRTFAAGQGGDVCAVCA